MGKKSEPKGKRADNKKDKWESDRGGKDNKSDNKPDKKWKDNNKRKKGKSYHSYDTREEIELAKTLAESNLIIHRMDGDGNCMFRSIADQLTGDPEDHEMIRDKIMKYITLHSDHFSLFMEDDENFDAYVERMKQLNEWGGHQELYAASQCFHTNITVYQLDNPTYIIQAGSTENKVPREIRLSYHGDCHYNSVRTGSNTANNSVANTEIATTTPATAKEQLYVFDDDLSVVQSAVPWIDKDKVVAVLQECKGDVDAAIELLCADTETISIEETSPVNAEEPNKKAPLVSDSMEGETCKFDGQTQNAVVIGTATTKVLEDAADKDVTNKSSEVTSPVVEATMSVNTITTSNKEDEKATIIEHTTQPLTKERKYRKNGDAKGKPLSKKEQRILDRELAREKSRGGGSVNKSTSDVAPKSTPSVHQNTNGLTNTIIL